MAVGVTIQGVGSIALGCTATTVIALEIMKWLLTSSKTLVAALAGSRPGDFLRLYCPRCELVYCFAHWDVEYSRDPEIAVGLCPQGHARVIDSG